MAAAGPAVERSQSTGPQGRHRRRNSEGVSNSIDAPRAGLSVKETNALIDKMQKENFDLKLRVTLQDERMKKMVEELNNLKDGAEETEKLQQKYALLEEKTALMETEIEEMGKEHEQLMADNEELLSVNDELVKEVEKRDSALEEAATMIHNLEREKTVPPMKSAKSFNSRMEERQDSDYYSAEPDSPRTPAVGSSVRPTSSSGSSVLPADSDYYSATSYSSPASAAPSAVPKTPRPLSKRIRPETATKPASHLRRISDESPEAVPETQQSYADHIPLRVSSAKKGTPSKPPTQLATSSTASASTSTSSNASASSSISSSATASNSTSSIHNSPNDSNLTPRPSLRRSRRGQAAAIASFRLQTAEQQVSRPPVTLNNIRTSTAAPPPLQTPAPIRSHQNHYSIGTPTPLPPNALGRSASEPPQEDSAFKPPVQWRGHGSRPLQALHMSGELSRPVTAGNDVRLRKPGEAPPNATPSFLDAESELGDDDSVSAAPTTPVPRTPQPAIPLRAIPNNSTVFRNSTGTMPDHFDDSDGADSNSPTATLPETISSSPGQVARRREERKREQYGSEYSFVTGTSVTAGGSKKSPPWNVSREIMQRDFMFRP